MIVIENDDQIGPGVVQQDRNPARYGKAVPVNHRVDIVVRNRLTVDGDPSAVIVAEQCAGFGKPEDIIQAHVDIAFSVVIEHIQGQIMDQGPLFFAEGHDSLSVYGLPYQR